MEPGDSTEAAGAPSKAVPQTVRSAAAARFLLDGAQQRLFHPFLGRESTVGAAAEALGVAPGALFYRVRTWLRLGLARVVREETRAGRAVKVYASIAERFFVPLALAPGDSLEDILHGARRAHDRRLVAGVAQAIEAADGWGLVIGRDGEGRVETRLSPADGAAAGLAGGVLDFYLPLTLGPAEAAALGRELEAVIGRYADGRGPGRRFLLHLGLAPTVSGD